MMLWAFAAVTVGALAFAAVVEDVKRATLALWVAGLGIGCVYLTLGAEVLAVVQWLVSTLVAISFVFFSVMFGEYGSPEDALRGAGKTEPRRHLHRFLGLASGGMVTALLWIGGRGITGASGAGPAPGNDLFSLGRALTEDHLLSLEVLALTFLLALLGGGVVARPDAESPDLAGKEES